MTPPDSGDRIAPTPCKHGRLGQCAYCMTGAEPDSGERRCPWIVSGKRSGQCFLRRNHAGPHEPDDPRKPDSGEREVCGAVIASVNGDPLRCDMKRGHEGAHEAKLAGPLSAHGRVMLPLPLAQRILAALEHYAHREPDDECTALAAELRAMVTK